MSGLSITLKIALLAGTVGLSPLLETAAEAQRSGGMGGMSGISRTRSAPSSIRQGSAGRDINRGDINRGNIDSRKVDRGNINSGNINRGNVNTGDINRGNINTGDINIDVDNGWNNPDWGYGYRPGYVAGAVVGAAVTAAVIGSRVYTLPPSCTIIVHSTVTYYNCSGTWYRPYAYGTSIQYTVVVAPY